MTKRHQRAGEKLSLMDGADTVGLGDKPRLEEK